MGSCQPPKALVEEPAAHAWVHHVVIDRSERVAHAEIAKIPVRGAALELASQDFFGSEELLGQSELVANHVVATECPESEAAKEIERQLRERADAVLRLVVEVPSSCDAHVNRTPRFARRDRYGEPVNRHRLLELVEDGSVVV